MLGWPFWALLPAVCCLDSCFRHAYPHLVIIAALCLFLTVTHQWRKRGEISARSWLFLAVSGLATGGLWLACFRALQLGDAARIVSVDTIPVVLVALFGVTFLGERLSVTPWFCVIRPGGHGAAALCAPGCKTRLVLEKTVIDGLAFALARPRIRPQVFKMRQSPTRISNCRRKRSKKRLQLVRVQR